MEFNEGDIVITSTGQAGCVQWQIGQEVSVLLRNGNIWIGNAHSCRKPQSQEELDMCPIDIQEQPAKKPNKRKRGSTPL